MSLTSVGQHLVFGLLGYVFCLPSFSCPFTLTVRLCRSTPHRAPSLRCSPVPRSCRRRGALPRGAAGGRRLPQRARAATMPGGCSGEWGRGSAAWSLRRWEVEIGGGFLLIGWLGVVGKLHKLHDACSVWLVKDERASPYQRPPKDRTDRSRCALIGKPSDPSRTGFHGTELAGTDRRSWRTYGRVKGLECLF